MIEQYGGIFFTSFFVALSGSLMPGPLLTYCIAESLQRGAKAGPWIILGHGLLELALLAALFWGLAPLLVNQSVFGWIALLGAMVLIWMGYGMVKSFFRLDPLPWLELEKSSKPGRSLIWGGVVMSLANPYWSLWWASIGLTYVLYAARFGPLALVVFFVGHILADLAWYCLLSVSVAQGRQRVGAKFYHQLLGLCGLFLILFALAFAWAGWQKIWE